ncbi:GFA family protein [Aeromonas simiae]|uniref:GFA family protein n=1 Tax=Aeromonas simiae TaxID=218936 RepID=A0A5J6WS62_9GAMM|nr:GFA family protein [Aeromonas simiae]QFI53959.1 GFA family protein [Aeromonas simiae]
MSMLTASCLCGAVQLRLPDRFDYVGHCHCSECRKFTGAAFSSVGGLDAALVTTVRGAEAIALYDKSAETRLAFCRHCGASLYSLKRSSNKLNLRLGILDTPPSQTPTFHIFVGSKAPWHEICDTLPRFTTRPGEE